MMASTIDIVEVRDHDFSAVASVVDGSVRLKLSGSADVRAIEPLTTMLPKLHAEAMRIGIKQVVVDFLELEFMNSSCFKSFVSWVSTVQEAPESYRVTFLSNPSILWQKRSLKALACFAADLISVETPS